MVIFEMKNCNMISTEKLQKYQHYHKVKLINMNILQVKKYYLLIRAEFFAGKITLDNADKDQGDSLNDFVDFNKRAKPRDVEKTNY